MPSASHAKAGSIRALSVSLSLAGKDLPSSAASCRSSSDGVPAVPAWFDAPPCPIRSASATVKSPEGAEIAPAPDVVGDGKLVDSDSCNMRVSSPAVIPKS